jgi:cytochrome c biogenesis factor
VFNNLFLTSACATVFVGTLYPLALEALTGAKISVGPPFFNATFGPLFVPLLLTMPFGPLLRWKRGDLLAAAQRLLAAALLAAVAIAGAFALQHGGPVLAPFGVGLAIFVMAGALTDLAERTMILRVPFGAALRRAAGLPRSAWGAAFAHFGIGITLLGIVAVTAWGSGAHRRDQAGRDHRGRALPAHFGRLVRAPRRQLSRPGRPFHRAAYERRLDRCHGAKPAHVPRPQHGDDRGCADDARGEPTLPFARRPEPRRLRCRCGSTSSRRC